MSTLAAGPWPLDASVAALAAAVVVLLAVGIPFTRSADELADRTGMGEAIAGGVFLAALTSLPGLIISGLAAYEARPSFAVSNAVGGIAAQTAFIVIADLFHRKANLEHAAASLPNLFQGTLLIALLSTVMLGMASPEVTIGPLHPATVLLVAIYVAGIFMTRDSRRAPMWSPRRTDHTLGDVPNERALDRPSVQIWAFFLGLGLLVALAGWTLARSGLSIASRTGLTDTLVGGVMTSVASSLPELLTAIFAVRAGALTLAVANIVGGNTFDVLIVGVADVFFGGSIYHAIDRGTFFVAAETMLLTAVLLAGLLRRDRHGIGFEGFVILGTYLAGAAILATCFG